MKYKTIVIITVFFSLILENAFGMNSFSEDTVLRNNCFKLPNPRKSFNLQSFASVSFVRLPYDWYETENSTTMLNLASKYSLPLNLNIKGDITVSLNSAILKIGPEVNFRLNSFFFGVGINGAYSYYRKSKYESQLETYGWSVFPNVAVAYQINDVAITIVAEYDFSITSTTASEEVEIYLKKRRLVGKSLGIFVEQRLSKNRVMLLGFVNNFHKSYFTTWSAQVSTSRFYYIPQIYIGIVI